MLFSRAFDDTFTANFTVVHWDQRGSGKSYDPKASISSFSADQVAEDGLVVVEYLRKKFNKSKILLVGHSWGSIVGSYMAKKKPEYFSAYISAGTVSDMAKADALKYDFLKKYVAEQGDKKDQEDFEKMRGPPWREFSQLVILSRLMTKFKGSFFGLDRKQINSAVEMNTEYSKVEMKNLDESMDKIWRHIASFLFSYKATEHVPELNLPVIFAQGKHDMATPSALAKEYFDSLIAPKGKNWVEFDQSAHFPMYEEPEAFLKLLEAASK